jgi:hypothetical protein
MCSLNVVRVTQKTMKRLFPLLMLLALAAPAQNPRKLVIGSWNIEWLGAPQRRSGPSKNVAQDPADLARYIRNTGVDILALEEICDGPASEFDPDNAILAQTLALLSQDSKRPWKYILFPKKDEGSDQLTGVAWNSATVSAIDGPFRIPLRDDPRGRFDLWQRWPQAMKFRVAQGETDFVLIPVHLKSNRKVDDSDRPTQQRAMETRTLMKELGTVRDRFADQDVIILGDSNCRSHKEPAVKNVLRSGYRDLNERDMLTYWKGHAPFDRIFVPLGQSEFANSRLVVHRPKELGLEPLEFKVRYSDHYLVTTEIQVGPDDD